MNNDPILLVVFILAALIGTAITAWVFAFMFDSSQKLKEAKKQTALLKLLLLKNGITPEKLKQIDLHISEKEEFSTDFFN